MEAAKGFFKRLTSVLVGREEDKREEEARDRTIPIDASVDLAYGNPVAELGPGDLFGEMTCMNFYPRSATVRADDGSGGVRDVAERAGHHDEEQNVSRTDWTKIIAGARWKTHLRGVPMFAGLSPDFIERLKGSVELVRFAPGQMIARQGEAADSFYLVRIGFVKIFEEYPGGELVLAYLSRGDYFGEIGLAWGRRANGKLHGAGSCGVGAHFGGRFPRDGGALPERAKRAGNGGGGTAGANAQRMQMVQSVPWINFCRRA